MALALVEMRWISEVGVKCGRFESDVVIGDGVGCMGGDGGEGGGVFGGVVEMVRREISVKDVERRWRGMVLGLVGCFLDSEFLGCFSIVCESGDGCNGSAGVLNR